MTQADMNQRTPGERENTDLTQTAPQLTRTLEWGFQEFGSAKDFWVSHELLPPNPILSSYSRMQGLWLEDCTTPHIDQPCSLSLNKQTVSFIERLILGSQCSYIYLCYFSHSLFFFCGTFTYHLFTFPKKLEYLYLKYKKMRIL